MPLTPPTPQDIVNAASEQLNNVVNTVVQQLAPVADAAQNANTSITQTANAFTAAVTQGIGGIQTAINQAITILQQQQGLALSKLHELLGNLPDVSLPSLITINGQGIETNPDLFYTTLRNLLNDKSKPIIIQFRGPLAAPLQPLNDPNLHDSLRRVVLPIFGLPPNSAVLNSDPVTITALICLVVICIAAPLAGATALGISAIFLALAAVLIIAAIDGRTIESMACPIVGPGITAPGGITADVPFSFCTQFKIGEARRNR